MGQAPPGSAQFGLEAGHQWGGTFAQASNQLFTTAVRMENSTLRGFWFGTQLDGDWGLEIGARRSKTGFSVPDPSAQAAQARGAWFEYAVVDGIFTRRWRLGHLEPYLGLGAGIANLNINVPDKAYRDTNRPSMAGSAGMRYWLAPWLALRLDARGHAAYLQKRDGVDGNGSLDVNRWLRTQELMAGVLVSFGKL